MSNSIHFHHLNKLQPVSKKSTVQQSNKPTSSIHFKDVFLNEINTIKISKHAQKRMDERNIQLSEEQLSTLNSKLDEAKQKGVKDSLVLVGNSALVVNASSKTVITALAKDEAGTQIFTNINGAIIMD